jgi:hypothetical protein
MLLSPAMVTSGKTGKSGKADARAARKARLAAALRENLKRRKQQARERAVAHKTPPADATPQEAEAAGARPDFRRNRGGE